MDLLENIIRIEKYICDEYLNIEPLQIVFRSLKKEDSRYYIIGGYICINKTLKDDIYKCIEAMVHELEHHYQWLYINTQNTPKAKRWRKEFCNYKRNSDEYLTQEIEIDAYAFTQIVMEIEFGLKIRHQSEEIQKVIDYYISSNMIVSDK